MKILWFDVETSGLDPKENDILTLSAVVEIDRKVVDEIDLKIQPFNYDNVSTEALKINGLTLEQIKEFDSPKIAHTKLVKFFDKHVFKFNKNDKFIPAGYNVGFDVNFLFEFFRKCGNNYCGSYIDYHKLDVASVVLFFKINKIFDFHGYKLVTIAKELDVSLDAHDAKEDILATRKIYYKLMDKIKVVK